MLSYPTNKSRVQYVWSIEAYCYATVCLNKFLLVFRCVQYLRHMQFNRCEHTLSFINLHLQTIEGFLCHLATSLLLMYFLLVQCLQIVLIMYLCKSLYLLTYVTHFLTAQYRLLHYSFSKYVNYHYKSLTC